MRKNIWIEDGHPIPDNAIFICREERIVDYIRYDTPIGFDCDEPVIAMGSIYEVEIKED